MTYTDVPEGYKKCQVCRENKPKGEFYKDSSKFDGLRRMCKDCDRSRRTTLPNTKVGKSTPEQRRRQHLKRQYGITSEEYEAMYAEQQGSCAICGDEYEVLAVDHCHDSKKVRGLLCTNCNVGIGMFKDNVDSLFKAIVYLQSVVD